MGDEGAPTGRAKRNYAKTVETRDRITASAIEVFAESGYKGGSLRAVAERVGLTDAGVMHHFPNKSALLGAVFARSDEQYRDQFEVEPGGGRQWFESLISIMTFNSETPSMVLIFLRLAAEATAADHQAHDYFVARYSSIRSAALAALQDMNERGELRDGVHLEGSARTVLALLDGLQLQWLLDPVTSDVIADVRRYLNSLFVVPL